MAAAVMHVDDHLLLVSGHADTDRRTRCPVLNSIGREIRERLYDSVFVPLAHTVGVAFKRDLAVRRFRLELVNDLSAEIAQVGGPWLDRNALAFTFASEIEQVCDHVLNAVDAAFDHLGVLLRAAARIGYVLNRRAANRIVPSGSRMSWLTIVRIHFSKSWARASCC